MNFCATNEVTQYVGNNYIFYDMKDVDTSVYKNLLVGLAAKAPLSHK